MSGAIPLLPLHAFLAWAGITLPLITISITKVKGKALPLQHWTGPEGSGSLRLPYLNTIGT